MDDTSLEAGLGFACKLNESTALLGREALERQERDGLKNVSHASLWTSGYAEYILVGDFGVPW